MDILDIRIVRIIRLDIESDLTLSTWFPVDSDSYAPGEPRRMEWQAMVTYILNLFGIKFYAQTFNLVADEPTIVSFPTPFDTEYIIQLGFARSQIQLGVDITDVTVNGFTITPIGDNATVDIFCIVKTPLT